MSLPRELLLCPPEHYGIEYEINPWMKREHRADSKLAASQWTGLWDQLRKLGCEVQLLAPQPKLPDLVFTANAGLLVGRKFFPSHFRHAERQGEEPHFIQWFTERDCEIVPLPDGMFFEGEGDALFFRDALFCGYKFRSDIRSHQFIADRLKCLVISVELVDDRFYHLDTCFCPLSADSAMWFPRAFDEYGQRAIRNHIPKLIAVEPEEAVHFACNAVVLGCDIILPEGCPKLYAELATHGFRTHTLPMTEFIKAGGGCKCLTLFLPQRPCNGAGEN